MRNSLEKEIAEGLKRKRSAKGSLFVKNHLVRELHRRTIQFCDEEQDLNPNFSRSLFLFF